MQPSHMPCRLWAVALSCSGIGAVLTLWSNTLLQGLEDPKLILQAVPPGLGGRRFPPPSAEMRVSFIPRRSRFSVTSRWCPPHRL